MVFSFPPLTRATTLSPIVLSPFFARYAVSKQCRRFQFPTKRRGTRQSADFDSIRDDISGVSFPKAGMKMQSFPSLTRPLTVHLGVVRAGTTVRRRFNVTNLNPVEVDVSSNSFEQDESSFAQMRFVGVAPLESAPRSLLEIGKHVQVGASNVQVLFFVFVGGDLIWLAIDP